MDAKLTQAADARTGAALLAAGGNKAAAASPQVQGALTQFGVSGDGQGNVNGSDWGFGWNIGYMYELDDATRFGLAYRSSVKHHLTGQWNWDFSQVKGSIPNAVLTGNPAAPGATPLSTLARMQHPNSDASVDVTTPETVSANVFHQLNSKVALMGDVTWTRNSRLGEIRIKQSTVNGVKQGDLVIHQNWRDTYRVSVGMNYQLSDAFLLRTGIGYDQSPVPDAQNRHPALPDSDRTLFSLGGNYKLNKNSSIDLAYTYMHFKDADINYTDTCNPGTPTVCTGNGETTKGTYKTHLQLIGLQYNYQF
jgi:long-chain fatty acid transport protein